MTNVTRETRLRPLDFAVYGDAAPVIEALVKSVREGTPSGQASSQSRRILVARHLGALSALGVDSGANGEFAFHVVRRHEEVAAAASECGVYSDYSWSARIWDLTLEDRRRALGVCADNALLVPPLFLLWRGVSAFVPPPGTLPENLLERLAPPWRDCNVMFTLAQHVCTCLQYSVLLHLGGVRGASWELFSTVVSLCGAGVIPLGFSRSGFYLVETPFGNDGTEAVRPVPSA
jgi:hypothetical protein